MSTLNRQINQNADIAIRTTVLAWLKMTYGKEFGTYKGKPTFRNVPFIGLKTTKMVISLYCCSLQDCSCLQVHGEHRQKISLSSLLFSSGVHVMQIKSKKSVQ